MKKVLFVDRDGVVLSEPPSDFQVDAIGKLAVGKIEVRGEIWNAEQRALITCSSTCRNSISFGVDDNGK